MPVTKYYPLVDRIPLADRPSDIFNQQDFRGKLTGEFRPPKKGEWYLSGAIPEGYRAPNDLTTSFHILKLVRIKKIETIVEI
jgi:hypothetical protein